MSLAEIVISDILELKQQNTPESYQMIKTILFDQTIVMSSMQINSGSLVRYRRQNQNGQLFSKISDLSYRKDIDKIVDFGRCNEPHQSIFYCNPFHYENTGIVESVTVFRGNAMSKEESFTVGLWQIKEPLLLGSILPLSINQGRIKEMDQMREQFEAYDNGPHFEELKKFVDFLAHEFSLDVTRDSSNYMVTAAFANYILEKFPQLDGFMYPSVKDEYEGINYALWPRTVDKKLKLIAAKTRNFERKPGTNEFWDNNSREALKIDNEQGTIDWS